MLQGMPGPGGSLGQCQICGKSFITEVAMGKKITVGRVPGIDCDLAVHETCIPLIVGKPWQEMPDGPVKEAFERALMNESEYA